MENDTLIGRRGLFRLGAMAALATAASPIIGRNLAFAAPEVCNPEAPDSPEAALDALVKGNKRWADSDQKHPDEGPDLRTCLAINPQTPWVSILSCFDSRCAPELIFDQGLGSLAVARVAGNTASGRLIDSLLFGTFDLGTQLLFVLGHSSCGAVSAAVANFPNKVPRLPFVELIYPAVRAAKKIIRERGGDPNNPDQVIPLATEQNVIITMNGLQKYFKLEDDQVNGGVYDLGTQLVTLVADF